jgi:hypothetical protein
MLPCDLCARMCVWPRLARKSRLIYRPVAPNPYRLSCTAGAARATSSRGGPGLGFCGRRPADANRQRERYRVHEIEHRPHL